MATAPVLKAELMVPETGHGGKKYPLQGTLRGFDGLWFRARWGTHHHRVVRIGPDGRSEDTSYRVKAGDFVEVAAQAGASTKSREYSIVGQRGSVVIAAAFRDRLGLVEGSVVIQEERDGGILLIPAEVVPRGSAVTLDQLLAEITPENLLGEVDTRPPVGRETL